MAKHHSKVRTLDLDGHPGLLLAPRDARALYVLAHGAGAGMRHAFMTTIAEALAERAIATLRWEFLYMAAGKPRPDRAEVAERSVRAVWNAARALTDLPMIAGGKSFGGRMTSRAHAAEPLADLRGIAFLGFPLHPPRAAPRGERSEREGKAPRQQAAPRGERSEREGKAPRQIDPGIERAEHHARATGPLLFLQGTRDDLAELRRLRPVVKRLGRRATLHVVDGADHGFDVLVRSGRKPADVIAELADTIAAWLPI
jgi:predicted alpha/beta-hydrolase family hydrolase